MSAGLHKSKLAYYDKKSQYVLMDRAGEALDTCHTLFRIGKGQTSLFEHIPFLESLQDLIVALQPEEELSFNCIRTTLLEKEGYFNFVFKSYQENVLWLIYDFTEHYQGLIPTQQERNNQAIAGEFMRIKQRATELEKQLLTYKNEELQRIQEIKTTFFSQVSHEMRTPINSIIGLASLLTDEDGPAKPAYVEALRATSQHLVSIVNDVLDLAKLESGQMTLETVAFSLRGTVKSVFGSFLYASQAKGIELSYTIDEQLPDYLKGDPVRLAQVLYNLVGNALKFTRQGSVRLRVKGQKKKTSAGRCTFGSLTLA
jgi:signal transduction histidine kinase